MNPQSTATPGPMHTKTHGHLRPISHKPGIVFNSPETQQWVVHGQPICPTSVSLFWNRISSPFSVLYIPTYDLMLNFPHAQPNQFLDCHGQPKSLQKFLQFQSHVLGPIKRPLTASNQPKHRKTLKNGNKTQVGRNPYLLEFVKNRKSGVHA